MNRFFLPLFCVAWFAASAGLTHAGTIIKLAFGADSKPDLQMVDGMISTFDDEFGATLGDQNTEVTLLGPLLGAVAVENDRASFTLENVSLAGSPTVIGSTLLQPTSGGIFSLYGPSNELLLSGTLGNGTLSGPIGGTATGGFLTTEFGVFTGGSLKPLLDTANLVQSSVSFSLTDVNEGAGLATSPIPNSNETQLQPFQADASANIGGQEPVPEPASALLAMLGIAGLSLLRRRG